VVSVSFDGSFNDWKASVVPRSPVVQHYPLISMKDGYNKEMTEEF